MKKILTTLCVCLSITLLHGQGTIVFNNTSAAFAVSTNTALSSVIGGSQSGGTSGKTAIAANGYYYALLTSTYDGSSPTSSALDNQWSFSGLMATNATLSVFIGGITGPGGGGGVAVNGWNPGDTNYVMVVGWSSNLGASWLTVSNELSTGNWAGVGYYGTSTIGFVASGGVGSPATPATSIFGGTGITGPTTLYTVQPVPEPGTIALATLGGLSMLALRR